MTHYLNDKALLNALLEKREDAVSFLYKENKEYCSKYILNNGGSSHDVDDIYQETLVVFIQQVRTKKFREESSVKTYLYAISRRLWLKELSRNKKIVYSDNPQEDSEDLNENEAEEMQLMLDRFKRLNFSLEKLGDPCKGIIKQFYLLKKSIQEIMNTFGYNSLASAKNQKYKCFKRLKKIYFKEEKL